ncbi:hypothetical protein K432DRAFT_289553 [Lepidopterella palustris CBS 459.81]|uniref:N-acetyltransferase domain-containing protein n=1 Tax=Lepidopterella palustris CBS 459.81 TaxID=1314670 RepID=A0A8E2EHV4_9PEZI|nr:hypothetical protein K432DRAFT_289553 [Lepidopterella palustris CBS 459.81]
MLTSNPAVLTSKILLVPYSEHHVPTYHKWMQDEELQKATASEPLTLDQEYAMQSSWRQDADKLTFIACTAPPYLYSAAQDVEISAEHDAPAHMFGDVNLFLYSDEEQEGDPAVADACSVVGEIEIMIALKHLQGNGNGKSILLAFLWYIILSLPKLMAEYASRHTGPAAKSPVLKYLRVRIDTENVRSVRLFESVGFQKVSEHPNYFGELELRWAVEGRDVAQLEEMQGTVPKCLVYNRI